MYLIHNYRSPCCCPLWIIQALWHTGALCLALYHRGAASRLGCSFGVRHRGDSCSPHIRFGYFDLFQTHRPLFVSAALSTTDVIAPERGDVRLHISRGIAIGGSLQRTWDTGDTGEPWSMAPHGYLVPPPLALFLVTSWLIPDRRAHLYLVMLADIAAWPGSIRDFGNSVQPVPVIYPQMDFIEYLFSPLQMS